jgi:hypothetical protein
MEDQLFSYNQESEPSVLSVFEQVALQVSISGVLAPLLAVFFGAWAGLIPVVVIGWATFFTTKPIEYILLYGWVLPWAKPDSRAHAAAGLVEALKSETDMDKCKVILQNLRELDRYEPEISGPKEIRSRTKRTRETMAEMRSSRQPSLLMRLELNSKKSKRWVVPSLGGT